MNYRHVYHAGNFADVVKHLILVLVIEHLKLKPAPFRIIDTHAGAGIYDLHGLEAAKTNEWQDGVGRLLVGDLPETLRSVAGKYLGLLETDMDSSGTLVQYPGSPLLARRLMRRGDVLVANELHPEDRERLADLFHHDAQTKVMGLDGYTALKALLPPKERRGVVLIDPPFEVAGEFARLATAVSAAHRRFATGILILWYPVKDKVALRAFHERLAAANLKSVLAVDFAVGSDDREPLKGLTETGLVIVNPPYTLEPQLQQALPILAERLKRGRGLRAGLSWIVKER